MPANPRATKSLPSAHRVPPVVLTIAGSDNSAGAGIQADLKTFTRHGCYGLTAVTCVVAEVPGRVFGIQAVNPTLLRQQILSCFEAFPILAVKTGMLYSQTLARTVAESLAELRQRQSFQLVIDPVMIASSGEPLLKPGAIRLYRRDLFPLAQLVTPNLDELSHLVGEEIRTLPQMRAAGRKLVAETGVPFLCKGGHLRGKDAVDLLITADSIREFRSPRFKNAETHGTGCTFSAAITASLAKGKSLPEAIQIAKRQLAASLQAPHQWGSTRALS